MDLAHYKTDRGYDLAYYYTPPKMDAPTVMFLGGFKSDMAGTKAIYLEEKCKERGQGFIRFDYSGHGVSEGDFVDGTIGQWKNDARDILDYVVKGDVILVGSSMGGWISLLLLLERKERIKGLVGIAAAPDFTKEIKAALSPEQLREIDLNGLVKVPNEYSDDPYIFTRDLLVDGAQHCLLDGSYRTDVPMVLVQGKQDDSVPWKKALRIQECFQGPQTEVIFIDDGDHRLSRDQDLAVIDGAISCQ